MKGTHPEDGLCIKCGIPLRKSHERIADRPGTRVHAGDGLCYTDWRQAKDAEGSGTGTVQANRAALDSYLSRRRPSRQPLHSSTKQLLTTTRTKP